jgi:hypothetical protein
MNMHGNEIYEKRDRFVLTLRQYPNWVSVRAKQDQGKREWDSTVTVKGMFETKDLMVCKLISPSLITPLHLAHQ